jgi:hypothetical protein
MAFATFIPTIWSGALLQPLRNDLIYAQTGVIVNRNYEGTIAAYGDTVKIHGVNGGTIKDYVRDAPIDIAETGTGTEIILPIDQAKYYNVEVDDVDQKQQTPQALPAYFTETATNMAEVIDRRIASHYAQADAANVLATTAITPSNAYATLVKLRTKLAKGKTPAAGRYAVVPPEFTEALIQDDRFVKAGSPESEQRLQNGFVGRAAGLNIFESNVVPQSAATGTPYQILAGHPNAITLAMQLVETEAYRPERRFSDAVKGLCVYGSKVIRPTNIAVAPVTF